MEQASDLFGAVPRIADKLEALRKVGLGYVTLGQPATTLSGGEAQRVKLARELSRKATGRTLYVLDEPTTGLHFADIEVLLTALTDLRDQGNTIIVIEHNLDVVACADWVIDLGPEGGEGGGEIVAAGTPEQVSTSRAARTRRATCARCSRARRPCRSAPRAARREAPRAKARESVYSTFAVATFHVAGTVVGAERLPELSAVEYSTVSFANASVMDAPVDFPACAGFIVRLATMTSAIVIFRYSTLVPWPVRFLTSRTATLKCVPFAVASRSCVIADGSDMVTVIFAGAAERPAAAPAPAVARSPAGLAIAYDSTSIHAECVVSFAEPVTAGFELEKELRRGEGRARSEAHAEQRENCEHEVTDADHRGSPPESTGPHRLLTHQVGRRWAPRHAREACRLSTDGHPASGAARGAWYDVNRCRSERLDAG